MTARELLSSLKGVKRNGAGWMALCPAHDDHEPSLSIKDGDSGGALLYCFAGCSLERICAALGTDSRELGFHETRDAAHVSRQISRDAQSESRLIVDTYDYHDEKGKLHYQVCRTEPKGFFQRRPNGNGKYVNGLGNARRVLYRLPELLAADPTATIFVPEGEKDVDNLIKRGFVATTNPGGAGKWQSEYNEAFRARNVCILCDEDNSGRAHSRKVADSLLGMAATIRVLSLPNLNEKGDVSDWLDSGGTVEDLRELAASAPTYKGDTKAKSSPFRFTTLDELLEEPGEEVDYVWDKTLPRGGFSICAAKPKVGKSTLARNLAVAVSRGELFFGRGTLKGKVAYLCLEEKRDEIRKHFERMGATGKDILIHTGRTPEDALGALEDAIKEHAPVLVIIDPLARFVRLADFNSYAEVTRALEPLIDLARESECQCHVLALHHNGKSEREAGDALLGSTAFFGIADSLLTMKRRQQVRTLETVQRYGEDFLETVVRLDATTGLVTPDGDLPTLLLNERKVAVLDSLGNEAQAEAEIKLRLGGNHGLTSRAVRALYEDAQLQRTGAGKKGDPYRYSRTSVSVVEQSQDFGLVGFPLQVNPENLETPETKNGRKACASLSQLHSGVESIEFEEGVVE
jgi:hypothetical protein